MTNPLLYQDEHFVWLEPDQPEQFLTPVELFTKLKAILSSRQEDLPRDLQKFTNLDEQVTHLINTSCDLEIGPGQSLQWYAVRLKK